MERAHGTEGADDGVHSPMHKVRRNVGYLAYPRERNPPQLKPLCHTSHHPGAHVASGREGKRHNRALQQEASGTAIADRVAAGRDTARPHTPDEGG